MKNDSALDEQLTIAKLALRDLDTRLTAAKMTISNQDHHIKAMGAQIERLLAEKTVMGKAYERLHRAVVEVLEAQGAAKVEALDRLLEMVS